MPPKKAAAAAPAKKGKGRVSEDDDDNVEFLDVQYNPELVNSLLEDLKVQIEAKCSQIKNDSDFMVTSIQQAFHLELIKLPTQIKKMPMAKFKQEYGSIFEAMTSGLKSASAANAAYLKNNENINSNNAIYGSAVKSKSSSSSSSSHNSSVYQTPLASKYVPQTPGTQRKPKEGEAIVSANGSPLGIFNTVVKQRPDRSNAVPATPGVFVPLENGEVLDVETFQADEEEFSKLSQDVKLDALNKMQAMMANMQKLMEKLGNSAGVTL